MDQLHSEQSIVWRLICFSSSSLFCFSVILLLILLLVFALLLLNITRPHDHGQFQIALFSIIESSCNYYFITSYTVTYMYTAHQIHSLPTHRPSSSPLIFMTYVFICIPTRMNEWMITLNIGVTAVSPFSTMRCLSATLEKNVQRATRFTLIIYESARNPTRTIMNHSEIELLTNVHGPINA